MNRPTLASFLVWILAFGSQAYPQQTLALKIIVIEGEGATNNIRQRVSREPIVEIRDKNDRPVAGATVIFLLPNQGASASFTNGSRLLTVTSNSNGQAAARGMQTNNVPGKYNVQVRASYQGDSAEANIQMENISRLGKPLRKGLIASALIATGIILAVVLTNGGSSAAATPPTPPTVITPGPPSVGGPK